MPLSIPRFSVLTSLVAALALATMALPVHASEVDADGNRVFSPVPKPGVHPRVYFSPEDLPAVKERLTGTVFGQQMLELTAKLYSGQQSQLTEFANLDFSNPTEAQIIEHFKPDEGRNQRWGMFALDAVVRDDAEQKQLIISVITNYSRLLIASKEMSVGGDTKGKTGHELNKKVNLWKNNSFDVSTSWLIGAAGMAVSYDLLYNDMTAAQQDTIRKAISLGTADRISYGMDMPRGKAVSNHYGYHGDLLVLLTAIEGEPGYDPKTYDRIKQVIVDYWEIGFTQQGACHEDSYGPNLGLRAGMRGMVALSRRGPNLFATDRFYNYVRYFAQELQPNRNGVFIGGASGGSGLPYPPSVVMSKYMRPQDPAADYAWRYFAGDNYDSKSLKWQGWLDMLMFATDYNSDGSKTLTPQLLGDAGLPTSIYYPERGKVIARSDWSDTAAYLHFDARPDAFSIGHDKVDRGSFVFDGLGRIWGVQPEWNVFRDSVDNSLLHIDGKAQAWKAPSVNMLAHENDDVAMTASADLKYAYDWQWSPPWPNSSKTYSSPWEEEHSDPRDLGYPGDPDWLPNTHYGTPDIGYIGSYMGRKEYNPVEKAFRSSALVRGHHPYAVIYDDFKKDAKPHSYEWYMQLPMDVELAGHDGLDIVLKETGEQEKGGKAVDGSRRLLVRVLHADGSDGKPVTNVQAKVEEFDSSVKGRNGHVKGRRLIVSVQSVEPKLKVMLLPMQVGEALPETSVAGGGDTVNVKWADQADTLSFGTPSKGKPAIAVTQKLAASRATKAMPLVLPSVVQAAQASGKKTTAPAVAMATEPQDEPVAVYTFDEVEGGRTGEPAGVVTGATSIEGKSGKALSFPGGGSHVALPAGLGSTQEGSVSLWMRADKPTDDMSMMFVASPHKKSSGNGGGGEFAIFMSNRGQVTVGCGGVNLKSGLVSDSQWHHVLVTWKHGDKLTLHVDGKSIGEKAFAPEAFAWTGHTTIGKPGADQRYFIGDLDEIKVYNRVITLDELDGDKEPS